MLTGRRAWAQERSPPRTWAPWFYRASSDLSALALLRRWHTADSRRGHCAARAPQVGGEGLLCVRFFSRQVRRIASQLTTTVARLCAILQVPLLPMVLGLAGTGAGTWGSADGERLLLAALVRGICIHGRRCSESLSDNEGTKWAAAHDGLVGDNEVRAAASCLAAGSFSLLRWLP